MQNSNISLFKQKNHIPLTILSLVLCIVLSPLIGSAIMLPQVLTLLPVVMLVLLAFVGPVSAVGCCTVIVALAYTLFGGWGALCIALLILPSCAASVMSLERNEPFWPAVGAGCVAMFVALSGALGLLTFLAGSDIVSAMMDIVRAFFADYPQFSDMLLQVFVAMGAVAVPEGYDAAQGILSIDEATRSELLSGILLLSDSMLRMMIPEQMATGSICAGLFGQVVLRRGAIRKGAKVDYPPLREWRIPKGWGRILGGTLAVLYVLSFVVPDLIGTMLYVFSAVFDLIFSLQGIAAICYMIHERGKSSRWQILVFVLGFTLLRTPATFIGIADQLMDFTHRRMHLDPPTDCQPPQDKKDDDLI